MYVFWRRWNAYVFSMRSGPMGTTIVCPALLLPAQRTQMSKLTESMSASFPLPSSPHRAPQMTMTATDWVGKEGG